MKTKSPILELTASSLDHVTGGCKLVATGTTPKALFRARMDSFHDLHATLENDDVLSSAHSFSSDLLSMDLEQASPTVPPMWCGPTNGLDWGHDTGDDDDVQGIAPLHLDDMAPLHLDDQTLIATDAPTFHQPLQGHGWGSVDAPPPVGSSVHHTDVAPEHVSQTSDFFHGVSATPTQETFESSASAGHADIRDHRTDSTSPLVRDHRG